MSACGAPTGMTVDYTLTVTQIDGNHLSYDEEGMPAIYGCFWAMLLAGLGVHVWLHYVRVPRFAPLMVIMYTACLASAHVAAFCHMIDWATVAKDGSGVPVLGYIGALMQVRPYPHPCTH